MVWYKKNVSILILIVLVINTVVNKWFTVDQDTKWIVAMVGVSTMLLLYSFYTWNRRKTRLNLIVMLIFVSEFIGVILGWNLNTSYFTEFMLILIVLGFVEIYKKFR